MNDCFMISAGEGQRQSVLMMVSSLVQFMGVTCLLPPVAPEPKLLQLVTHLAAIEVRMATENCSAQQVPHTFAANMQPFGVWYIQ